jgi:hypothetical protein
VKHFVEIHLPNTSPQRIELSAERLALGTGALSSIHSSSCSGVSCEQVELFAAESGVRVQIAPENEGTIVFEGTEYRSVFVPWKGEVFFGSARLTFLEDTVAGRAGPVLVLLAPMVFIALGLGAYQAATPDELSSRDVSAPPLYDEQRVIPCPERNPSDAEHRARDDERMALAKQERLAFDAAEGFDALTLLHEAQACFRAAEKLDESSRLSGELTRWSRQLATRYATLRLRLRGALDENRATDALAAVRELQAMLAHRNEDPYHRWLTQLRRTLEQQIARTGS